MSYYEPLTRFLEDRRKGTVMLTFQELEGILGRNLPASARKHQAWWANTPSHSHAGAWLRLDWKTSQVDLAGERVTFAHIERSATVNTARKPDHAAPVSTSMTIDLDQISVAGRRIVNDYAAEMGGDVAAAVARAVHEAAIARRGRLIDELIATAPRVPAGAPSSLELLHEGREERDGR